MGIIDQLNDELASAQQSGDIILYNQLTSQDFVLSSYLSTARENRMGCPIIHAVDVKSWKCIDKHDDIL